jgi:hemin uptake protein HemP
MTDQRQLLCDHASDARWTDIPVHRSITSNDLMAGEHVIIIRHGQEEYRLRLTASGKLILTR